MPFFKTTSNILQNSGEYFDPNWMDSDKLVLPPSTLWDYQREMQIEDVNIWEQIVEGGRIGVYAAWDPYAEFYLVKSVDAQFSFQFETFYGKGALKRVTEKMKALNLTVNTTQHWVEQENMWLYT